mgnify:CR=1 FL=1
MEAAVEETLETFLPPPGLLRRNAEKLGIDKESQQRIEELYREKEPRYHQLRYNYERLAQQLYSTLAADDLDEMAIVAHMKALLDAENQLKLYQVHVRLSLLSQLSPEQRRAVRELAKRTAPPANWRGGITSKVEKVRALSERLKASGGSLVETERQMKDVDKMFADGKVGEGLKKLDAVILELEKSLQETGAKK